MKHFKHFALAVLVALASNLSANAHDFEVNGIYYKITSATDLTCEVTYKGTGADFYEANSYSGDISIPSTVNYDGNILNVTSIGTNAFYQCVGLTSVNIPNTVKAIGFQAFRGCTSLSDVQIPNSVTSIDAYAFHNCTSLPVENGISYAGTYAVSAVDKDLTSYNIKDGTRFIGSLMFYNCKYLTSIKIPRSVLSVGFSSFQGCSSLTSVELPRSVTFIGNYAFRDCSSLTSVKVNNLSSVIGIAGSDVFKGVSKTACTLFVPLGSKEDYKLSPVWQDFINIQEFEMDLELNIVDATTYAQTSDATNATVYYTRNFETNVWQALYIPFDMTYDEWKDLAEVAEISGVHMYDDNEDGEFERSTIEFKRIKNENAVLKPNTPYVIKPKQTGEVTFECEGKTLKAAEERSVWCATTRQKFTLTGIYQPKEDMAGVYALGTDGKFHRGTSASPALSPNRFYLTIEDVDNGYGSAANGANNAPRVIDLIVDGESTGIESTQASSVDGKCYDLSGRAVKEPKAGIYIKNGKKVIIK